MMDRDFVLIVIAYFYLGWAVGAELGNNWGSFTVMLALAAVMYAGICWRLGLYRRG